MACQKKPDLAIVGKVQNTSRNRRGLLGTAHRHDQGIILGHIDRGSCRCSSRSGEQSFADLVGLGGELGRLVGLNALLRFTCVFWGEPKGR
jgi:hypothetical protein